MMADSVASRPVPGSDCSVSCANCTCARELRRSTVGASPDTVIVSSSVAHRELAVHRCREFRGNSSPSRFRARNPGRRERHRVDAGPQIDDPVQALSVGDGGAHFFDERRAGGFHRYARQDSARFIADDAGNAALRPDTGRQQQEGEYASGKRDPQTPHDSLPFASLPPGPTRAHSSWAGGLYASPNHVSTARGHENPVSFEMLFLRQWCRKNVRSLLGEIGRQAVKLYRVGLVGAGLLCVIGSQAVNGTGVRQAVAPNAQIERGRYIVEIGGCNDCHTAGYAEAGGKAAETDRLKGDRLGFRGPWGTTYPT